MRVVVVVVLALHALAPVPGVSARPASVAADRRPEIEAGQTPTPKDSVIDRLMAVVDGQAITLSDVNAAIHLGLIHPPSGTADPLAFALDRLIERTLMLAEVDRFQPPEPDPIEITTRIDEIVKREGDAAFEKTLSVTGTTREQLRRFIRDELRIATYLNQRFGDTPERPAAIAAWVAELRRRADVSVQYKGR
jgi:hypothetical protein